MSGDQLRQYAFMGDDKNLRAILRGGANPCSRDKVNHQSSAASLYHIHLSYSIYHTPCAISVWLTLPGSVPSTAWLCSHPYTSNTSPHQDGLTALHYACWNGHTLCAEILVANDHGTDEDGEHISSLDLQSDSGFTALHLSVSGTVPDVQIVRYLVLSGANVEIQDTLGRTAMELAEECGFQQAIETVFNAEPPTDEECDNFYKASREQHLVQQSRSFDFSSCAKDEKGNPIITRDDKMPMPVELTMYEHHIFPYATKNYKANRKDGAEAIQNLESVLDEAMANEKRRDLLANSVEANLRKSGKMNWRRGSVSEDAAKERKRKNENRFARRGSVIK
jgi:ankyrin repeat protein